MGGSRAAGCEGVIIFCGWVEGASCQRFVAAVLVAFICPVSCCYAPNERGVICLLLLCTHHPFGLPSAHADLSLFINFRRWQPVKGLFFFCGWVEGVPCQRFVAAVLVAFIRPVSCCYAPNDRGVICLLLCTHHPFGLPSAHADLSFFINFRRWQPVKGLGVFFVGGSRATR